MIGIIDVGISNVGSVARMIDRIGGETALVNNPKDICSFDKLIIPGVGSFDNGIQRLESLGLKTKLQESIYDGECQVLGICLGMQMLCHGSEEGEKPGLGLVDAYVRRFKQNVGGKIKIPHMGWNTVDIPRENPLLPLKSEEQRFYFVHSYRVIPEDKNLSIANAWHGETFCAAYQSGNIFGVQFHPEKSHRFGMALIKHFIEL